MGVVFRALDPAIGRTVAIKTIRLADLGGAQDRERLGNRLLHEARSAGALSHPGIVIIYDVGEHDDVAYIAMEFVNGPTLEHVLASGPAPGRDLVLRVLNTTAAALDYAHRKLIVHRDIKPANIMLHEDGSVKITDFGVAKFAAGQLATQTGTVVGTPCYMSPEQALGKPVDGRSDQFSLAVVAYEMLTGEKPFGSESLASVAYRVAHEDPPSASTLNHTLGRGVDAVFRRALDKAPDSRYPTCLEFAGALEAACHEAEGWAPLARGGSLMLPTVEVRPPAPTHPAAPGQGLPGFTELRREVEAPARSPKEKKDRAALALIAAGILVVTVSAVWLWRHFTGGEPQQSETTPPALVASGARPSPAGPAASQPEPNTPPEAAGLEADATEPGAQSPAPPLTQPARTPAPTQTGYPAEATVQVRTTPPGAAVVFDSRPELNCTSPCSLQLPVGRHTASAALAGYRSALRIFRLPDESDVFLYLTPQVGQVNVNSEPPGASILINGQRRNETTPATFELPAGKYVVTVVREGYQQDQQEITLKDSAFVRLSFTLGK